MEEPLNANAFCVQPLIQTRWSKLVSPVGDYRFFAESGDSFTKDEIGISFVSNDALAFTLREQSRTIDAIVSISARKRYSSRISARIDQSMDLCCNSSF